MSEAIDSVLTTEMRHSTVVATINRPDKGNALDANVIDALAALIEELDTPATKSPMSQATALIITGGGSKVFSAGADINGLVGLSRKQARLQMIAGQNVFTALEDLRVPVIAAINGIAYGGGLELAMACDIRVAVQSARLGQPEITLANIPGWGGTQRLPRLVGEGRALEMIMTGDPISASRAYEIGLVNVVADNALDAALELAERLSRHSAEALEAAKFAVYSGLRHGAAHGFAVEAELVGDRCASDEQRAAVQDFLNRKNK